MKRILKIAGIALAVLIAILVVLPFLINVNGFRPKLEATLSDALGRQVTVGNLSLSILSGSVAADNIAIADDPAFGSGPFVTAKSLKVGVEVMPLLTSKELHITGIELEQPEIGLRKGREGKWNFSSLGGNSAKKSSASSSGGSMGSNFSVAKLNINDGRLIISNASSKGKANEYDKVNIEVRDFSLHSQFPYTMTTNLPGGGDAKFDGTAGPINPNDAAATPFQAKVKVNKLDLAATGFVDPATGIAGLADFDGTLASDGKMATAVGLMTANKLKLSPKGTPTSKTVQVKHAVEIDLAKQSGTVSQGDIALGKAIAHVTGAFRTLGDVTSLNMKLDAPSMPVDELEAMLPALGIVLPSGSSLKGGTLSANLVIDGPLDKLVIVGPVRLTDTQLAGFNLGSKLSAISALTGKNTGGNDTSIQNFSSQVRIAPEGTRAEAINLTIPALGAVTGAGGVSPAGALNFKMNANLSGGAVTGITQMAGLGGKGGSVPFLIAGTTANPQFVPDVKGMAGGLAGGALEQVLGGKTGDGNKTGSALENALGGLLGKKKPQ
jgi:AsmA protein